jgi:2-iminobutanoate/2-iminopropanoate deaminase
MSKQFFKGDHPLPFSDLIVDGSTAYIAGQVGFDSQDKLADNIEDQTRQSLENLKTVFAKSDFKLEDIVRVGVYLTDKKDFAGFNKVYSEYFKTDRPVRTTIFTQLARDEFLVELDAIATK